jgi:NAD(P)-dependent dehydrogenase (short-subunit alcohol dehydrogenase family)
VPTVLVTGASRGLGLALCRILADRGDDVLAVCRRPSPELQALAVEVLPDIDLARDEAVAQLRDGLAGRVLDLVIANAGVNNTYASGIEELDLPSLRGEFEVNTFGVVRTVQGTLPSLGAGAKIAFISTWRPGAGAASRNYGYQMSKVATNQLSFLLADELARREISTILLSPGPMETELLARVVESGHANLRPGQASDPQEVAADLLERIDELAPPASSSGTDDERGDPPSHRRRTVRSRGPRLRWR